MKITSQFLVFMIGLTVFSYGIAATIQVQYLGIHPWDVLNVALFDLFGLTIGTWAVIVGFLLVIVSFFLDRTYLSVGTFLNALLIGPMVDLFMYLDYFPKSSTTITDVFVLLFGILLMGIGGGVYSAAGLGAGPRDGFMLSISDKLGFSISRVRIITESAILVIGWLLGGPVFVFTFIFTFLQSPVYQFFFLTTRKRLEKLYNHWNPKKEKKYKKATG
ncbi:YitT family protein [Aquibacillus sp. 3ASR75-11]|uniref:YitT family protein n=1 Tax=Terrihalobacillus insolitus TaxID=2950438 RepID=A0A9X3WS03_9BACI|nr:YitT family protein [Terrihalobacillus insolitus]MDC3412106.1 YitT family protein [Terrihalobacillus insolitus]MDC3423201.1 YitT family protein [Terrihalobacillus insolitus]